MSIPTEAIEAAARAIADAQNVPFAGRKQLLLARAALTAAAPFIQAAALRDVLAELPEYFTEYTKSEVGFGEFADGVTAVYDRVRARAYQLEGKTK